MGYLRVDCRAGVFALLDTLPKVSTLWETNIQQLKPSLRGLPGTRARYTGLTNTLEDAKNRLRCSFKGWILDQGHTLEELVDITTGIRARAQGESGGEQSPPTESAAGRAAVPPSSEPSDGEGLAERSEGGIPVEAGKNSGS